MGSFLGDVWNWMSGKDKCPACASRSTIRLSDEVIKSWQEVRSDYLNRTKENPNPQAWFNCYINRAKAQCNNCGNTWAFKYNDAYRA